MAEDYKCCNSGSVFLAFVMGAAIGGGLALLTAPRSGEETRNKVRGMADDVRRRIKDIAEEAEARIKETIEEGREVLQEKADIVKSAVEAGKEAMEAERAKHQKPA
ncbi:MAG TPA: YtxH domain-containing protein [Desulfuromonadales bacterium]|jgi:gas vesicle protein|nr:YtxH domain-containing protein [Desulfuromonadales bacterium]